MATVDGTVNIDNWLDKNAPTTNRNALGYIRVGNQGGADGARGIVRFTMPSDPGSGSTIDKIEVMLYKFNAGSTGDPDIACWYGTNTPATTWSETTSTWNNYSTGNAWTASGALSDFTTLADTINVPAATSGQYFTWTVQGTGATNDIGATWDDVVNFVFQDTNTIQQTNFDDRNDANPPIIRVTYTEAGGAAENANFFGGGL